MKQLKSFDIYDGKEHAREYDFVRVSRESENKRG